MKKLILGMIVGISFTALIATGIENYVVGKQTATAEKSENIIIFTDSKPVMEYDYLGTIKMAIAWTGKYDEIRSYMLKQAKKKYPNAEAIIMDGVGSADVIKFK